MPFASLRPLLDHIYSRLVGVRACEWSKYFEECMVGSVVAHELEEEIGSVDASVGDLVGSEEARIMARKTWDFRLSLMTEEMIEELEKAGCFAKVKGGLHMAR